ncbi:acylphosphatase [Vigna umbellata]|uniref:acylphosphatase n=1 Tax=Vigna umbellata TaxID=87088 RepID=UPI001F5F705B|nr:acylphosphatase [Vigna umbellata]
MAPSTVTLIPPRFTLFTYPRNNASRIFHLRSPLTRSISAMTTQQGSSSTKTERVVIKGRVQGVFYRNWTIENATQLGLKGWVRNRKDGSVEALFSGNVDAVQEMEQRCRRGPPDALVTGLQVFPSDDDPGTGFHRKPTL